MAIDRARFRMAVEGGVGAFPRFRPVKRGRGRRRRLARGVTRAKRVSRTQSLTT